MKHLDFHSAVPLYHQLFTQLHERIARGKLKPGALLPSEAELERTYEVSRITVRRALDELRQRGLVSREKGRGTRVLPEGGESLPIVGSVEGMIEKNLAMGLKTEVDLLEFGYVRASPTVAQALNVAVGDYVQRSVRVRRLKDAPFSHLTTHVREEFGRRYDAKDLATHALLVLLERAGVTIERAEQLIYAKPAARDIAALLNVPVRSALLCVERTVYATPNTPVEHIVALYKPDVYKYRMTLRRHSGSLVGLESPKERSTL